MTRRSPIIEPKSPIYFGCEGESEVAYGQVLNDLLRSSHLNYHLHVEPLTPGAGDPLARVRRAIQRISEYEKRRPKFEHKVILIDNDQVAREPQRADDAENLANQNEIRIIWQNPCHEALLLRHMPNCADRRPPTTPVAQRELERIWPDYQKPMVRAKLVERIDLNSVQQAALVEPRLRNFLEIIHLLP